MNESRMLKLFNRMVLRMHKQGVGVSRAWMVVYKINRRADKKRQSRHEHQKRKQ